MHTALIFISVLLEIISPMLFLRQHQKLIYTKLNSRGVNTANMPRNVSICIYFPSLTCIREHVFFDPSFLCRWYTCLICTNDTLYLFIALKIILACICSLMYKIPYILTRLIKYCCQVITSNRKQIQPLIIFLTYIYHSTYLQVHMTCQGSCMFEG